MSTDLAPPLRSHRQALAPPRMAQHPSHVAFLRPAAWALTRLLGGTPPDLTAMAVDRWEVAPVSAVEVRPAKRLPQHLDRIHGAAFATISQVVRDFAGGFESAQPPTVAHRLKNVLLHDGVLYAEGAVRHLRHRSSSRYFPAALNAQEYACGSLFESSLGNRWFGNWLSDDCLAYRLAAETGSPFTTDQPTGHKGAYAERLAILPERVTSAWFRELTIFDDFTHNQHKRARADDMRRRLIAEPVRRHPGTFLLRGRTGDSRVLLNERAIAEHLASKRGFTIIDPSTTSVDDIVRACAGAQVIAGVEGSHLVHGLVAMPQDACALVIQPPMRAVSALKLLTDRQGQDYALVVGKGNNDGFVAAVDEVERTLDLV